MNGLRIWLRAGWRTYGTSVETGVRYLTNADESRLLRIDANGRVEELV